MDEKYKDVARWYNRIWKGNKRTNFKARKEWTIGTGLLGEWLDYEKKR